ncbi:hypothetical protein OBBRIDRAFT_788481 [Obba rivulosa]|uniref:Uncharacterized protein n=1 Tax=Obba rivulosa TaxID=1052685 RepID=A0A8E2J7L6_9APHY|nr:hypothetical protein OBBRIDRAFT_788481 [Obba rivulosa]
MPRRAPPTPLRLVSGPLPGRGQPKHTLPSMPRPAFHPPARTAAPRARATAEPDEVRMLSRMDHTRLPPLVLPQALGSMLHPYSGPGTPTSAGSSNSERSRPPSPTSSKSDKSDRPLRAPWNHSESIHVPFDVGAVLAPLQPAAVNPALLR